MKLITVSVAPARPSRRFDVLPDMITVARADQRLHTDGRGARQQGDLRNLHARTRWHQAVPRLYLSAHPAASRGRAGDAGHLARGPADACQVARQHWEEAARVCLPHVIGVRNYGLILGLELEPLAGKLGRGRSMSTEVLRARRVIRQGSRRSPHRRAGGRAGADRPDIQVRSVKCARPYRPRAGAP